MTSERENYENKCPAKNKNKEQEKNRKGYNPSRKNKARRINLCQNKRIREKKEELH